MIRAVRFRKILPGELRLNLLGVARETVLLDLPGDEVRERLVKGVQNGTVEAQVLAMLDGAGVPLAVLEAIGYGASDLAKAESRALTPLAKSGGAEPRSRGFVEVEATELERVTRNDALVRRYITASGGLRAVHPMLRDFDLGDH